MYKDIQKKREYERKYRRERREWFHAHHLCTECGERDAFTMIGKKRCASCVEKDRIRKGLPPVDWLDVVDKPKRKHQYSCTNEERRRRGESGLCYLCGRKAKQGTGAWTGKPFHLCEEHYSSAVRNIAIATEEYKKKHNGMTYGQVDYEKRHASDKKQGEG